MIPYRLLFCSSVLFLLWHSPVKVEAASVLQRAVNVPGSYKPYEPGTTETRTYHTANIGPREGYGRDIVTALQEVTINPTGPQITVGAKELYVMDREYKDLIELICVQHDYEEMRNKLKHIVPDNLDSSLKETSVKFFTCFSYWIARPFYRVVRSYRSIRTIASIKFTPGVTIKRLDYDVRVDIEIIRRWHDKDGKMSTENTVFNNHMVNIVSILNEKPAAFIVNIPAETKTNYEEPPKQQGGNQKSKGGIVKAVASAVKNTYKKCAETPETPTKYGREVSIGSKLDAELGQEGNEARCMSLAYRLPKNTKFPEYIVHGLEDNNNYNEPREYFKSQKTYYYNCFDEKVGEPFHKLERVAEGLLPVKSFKQTSTISEYDWKIAEKYYELKSEDNSPPEWKMVENFYDKAKMKLNYKETLFYPFQNLDVTSIYRGKLQSITKRFPNMQPPSHAQDIGENSGLGKSSTESFH